MTIMLPMIDNKMNMVNKVNNVYRNKDNFSEHRVQNQNLTTFWFTSDLKDILDYYGSAYKY